MKTSKLLLIALAYTILCAASIKSLIGSEKPEEASDDFVSKIIRESGINTAVNVTRDNIKDIWHKVLNRLYPEDYPLYEDSFKGMVEKYISELPEAMPRMDLAKYFSQERMTKFLHETQQTYGEKFAGYMRGAYDKMKSLWYSVAGKPHEETFTEKVKRVVVENTPDMIKDAMKTDV
jgi:hypothetical protein